MKKLALTLAVLGTLGSGFAEASTITWGAAQNSAAYTDVVTQGTLVQAVNATNVSGTTTINGVVFSNSDATLVNGAGTGFLSNHSSQNAGYDSLLNSLDWGNGVSTSIQIGSGNLVAGKNYLVEVWYTDVRNATYAQRNMTFSDGVGHSVTLNASGANGLGQFVTGTFTASSATQTLGLQTNGFGNAHINGWQVRDITAPVPEPETYAMFLAGLGIMGAVARRRKKQQA